MVEQIDIDIIPNDCSRCSLYKHRTNIVWGDGNPLSPVCFVGEAPGREEDLSGKAFVGDSGSILDQYIEMFKIKRERILILNTLKCRPPNNRNPTIDELLACKYHFRKQVKLCPNLKVFIAMGRVAWLFLTGDESPVTKFHGTELKMGKYINIYTYHPSYLLRNRKNKQLKKEFLRDIRKGLILSGLK